MKAFILAAGRGERMRPLTDKIPKPLLVVGGEPLIVHTIKKLANAGVTDLVINLTHLGDQIESCLQDGKKWGVNICYSREQPALETAGGIVHALPLIGDQPFLLVNGDIWTDFDFAGLSKLKLQGLAHLLLVSNPSHNPGGDFCLQGKKLTDNQGERLTYSGIGLFSPEMFAHLEPGIRPLAPLLRAAIVKSGLTAEKFDGQWWDIGTPERLHELNRFLS